MEIVSVKIVPSSKADKKYMAVFTKKNGSTKTTHFGQAGAMDYILYHKQDPELAEKRKRLYLNRHKNREDWRDGTSAGALSAYVLWNRTNFHDSVADYKRRFNL